MADIYDSTSIPFSSGDVLKVLINYEIFRGSGPFVVKSKVMHFVVISKVPSLLVSDFLSSFVSTFLENGFCHLLADTVRF